MKAMMMVYFSLLLLTTQAFRTASLAMAAGGAHAYDASSKRGVILSSLVSKAKVPLPKIKSLYDSITFSWAQKLLDDGNKNVLQLENLWMLEEGKHVSNSSEVFGTFFQAELDGMKAGGLNSSVNSSSAGKSSGVNILRGYWSSPLTRAIVKMFKKELVYSGVLKFFNTCVQFLPSIIIAGILKTVEGMSAAGSIQQAALRRGVMYSMLLFVLLSIKTFVENQYFHVVTLLGADIRCAVSAAIYRKALKLSPSGRQNTTMGEVVNYMQLDSSRLEYVASSIHVVWDGLLQVVGYTALLLHFLGVSVLAGIAAMLVIIPVNAIFFTKLSKLRSENLRLTDQRVKLTNELLQGVRSVKAYNWEKPFTDKLAKVREAELNSLKASANTRAILIAVLSGAPSVVSAVTLSVYALMGNALSPTKVFTALALFNQLRFPLIFFPMLLNTLAEGKVSLNRLTGFLLADEVENYVTAGSSSSPAIGISGNGTFSWYNSKSTTKSSADQQRSRLVSADLSIKRGELVAVVGPVGSGKSTLLSALLGELHKEQGEVTVSGDVAYVPQSAWIPNDSLRNVVLFGREFDQQRYDDTIRGCGLEKDLQFLEAGDLTEIGERGVNLSGGQKQRVSMARAVYEDADVYLLDDPLSALDAEVGARVFKDCIKGNLRGKTRVLVTHQLGVLPDVDRIIIMGVNPSGSCEIRDVGSLSELLGRGHDLSKLVRAGESALSPAELDVAKGVAPLVEAAAGEESGIVDSELIPTGGIVDSCGDSVECLTHIDSVVTGNSTVIAGAADSALPTATTMPAPLAAAKLPTALMTTEERAEGSVGLEVYRTYIKATKKPLLLSLVILSFGLANACQIGQQYVISAWTSDVGYTKRPLQVYLGVMTIMAGMVSFFNWARTCLQVYLGAAASQTLHNNMLTQVLNAPLNYFESTPVGRLVQRFSKDLDQIDQQLPGSFAQFISSALSIISSMVAISMVTPSFGLVMVPVFVIYFHITNYYRTVARELKRLDSVSRSPIYSHFGETLGGLSVIRSYARQALYKRTNEFRLSDNLAAYFALKVTDRWLSVRLELLANIIVFFSSLLAVFAGSRAGLAGISLNNALTVTSLLNWAVRNGAETESLMNSVERVLYTTLKTPQERPMTVDSIGSDAMGSIEQSPYLHSLAAEASAGRIPSASPLTTTATSTALPSIGGDKELLASGWPWRGGLTFDDVELRYRDDFDLVLKGVQLRIAPGEKVGIVGRTGSGKSSLFRALLRLTELESGRVRVDGVDASRIGLNALRASISIIPQDPFLFSGSIRLNLDPFGQHSDETLLTALRKANLFSIVATLPGGLAYEVSEGGDNFSIGQRQLFCLARALVKRSKILLLDEATSSIDYQTDAIIQKTIQEEFSSREGHSACTVLTIAHRLDTIMESDKVLVMSDGRVAEFASPHELLSDKNSMFSALVKAEQQGSGSVSAGSPASVKSDATIN